MKGLTCFIIATNIPNPKRSPLSSCYIAFIEGNYVHGNGDAGMALMEAFNATVSNNVFEDNKYGVRLSVGSANNVFADNNITGSTK